MASPPCCKRYRESSLSTETLTRASPQSKRPYFTQPFPSVNCKPWQAVANYIDMQAERRPCRGREPRPCRGRAVCAAPCWKDRRGEAESLTFAAEASLSRLNAEATCANTSARSCCVLQAVREEHMLPTEQAKALADEDSGVGTIVRHCITALRAATSLTKLATSSGSLETKTGYRWSTRCGELFKARVLACELRSCIWPPMLRWSGIARPEANHLWPHLLAMLALPCQATQPTRMITNLKAPEIVAFLRPLLQPQCFADPSCESLCDIAVAETRLND